MPFQVNQKNMIADAFESLLSEKSFDQITISDIAERCQISRSTFYRYFKDKYEIPVYIFTDELDEQSAKEGAFSSILETLVSSFRFYQKRRKTYLKTSDYNGQNSLCFALIEHNILVNTRKIKDILNADELDEELLFSIRHATSAQQYHIDRWLMDGCREKPEELAEYIIKISKQYYKMILDAHLNSKEGYISPDLVEIETLCE